MTTMVRISPKKGHKTKNCIKLHHKVQDIIEDSDIIVDVHDKNIDHKAFKEPFPSYEKGEKSKKKSHNKINYTHSIDDTIASGHR